MSGADQPIQVSKALTVLKKIGSTIVKISQQCLVEASNTFVLDLQADTITLENVNVSSTTNRAVSDCNSRTGIAEGPLRTAIDDALTGVRTAAEDGNVLDPYAVHNGYKDGVNFTFAIKNAINVDVVNRCLAMALNSMVIRFREARTISIKNVTVNQVANAEITECIGNVEVRIGETSQTLMQFLERNHNQYDYEDYKDPPPFKCQKIIDAKKKLKYGGAGIIGFSFLVLIIVLLVKFI